MITMTIQFQYRIQWGSQHPLGFLTLSVMNKLHAEPHPGFLTLIGMPKLEPVEHSAISIGISVMLLSFSSLQPCSFLRLSIPFAATPWDNQINLLYETFIVN